MGLPPRIAYIPRRVAWPIAVAMENTYRAARLAETPLLTRYLVAQLSSEYTLDLSCAVDRLGYEPKLSHADYLEELSQMPSSLIPSSLRRQPQRRAPRPGPLAGG
jgi:hypothetical protein